MGSRTRAAKSALPSIGAAVYIIQPSFSTRRAGEGEGRPQATKQIPRAERIGIARHRWRLNRLVKRRAGDGKHAVVRARPLSRKRGRDMFKTGSWLFMRELALMGSET